jgi:hypothetical protein
MSVTAPTPQWGSWIPGGGGAVPPSCFSELAKLNQCYNEVQMMEYILSKIMIDLIQNNSAVIDAIIAEIQKSGSSVPIIGITNGQPAQPGQVGEYIQQYATGATSGAINQTFNIPGLIVQPGDWDMMASAFVDGWPTGIEIWINPTSAGMSNNMQAVTGIAPTQADSGGGFLTIVSPRAQGLFSVPTLIPWTLIVNLLGAGIVGAYSFLFSLRRMR